jgi:histidyl-tRNA synthetase
MNDILPDETPYWRFLENQLINLAQNYGYQEIRVPLVEYTQLFARSIGEVTDIVEKEMYTFADRNGDYLTLRPEGTAGCVRAAIEHGMVGQKQQKLWYLGPLFRYERPQKGRYRQFHQFGVEAFGMAGPDIDVEQILLGKRMLSALKLDDVVELQLNSLGSFESRARYREKLIDYFKPYFNDLDTDSQRRLHSNPLRILDSKNPEMQELIHNAPRLVDHMDQQSRTHFDNVCRYLDDHGLNYRVNPYIVRGLDYYCHTVFEWVSNALGAQGTVCAGGRYDGLVEQLGGRSTPAVGFAVGLERLVELLKQQCTLQHRPHAYMIMVGEKAVAKGLQFSEYLRCHIERLRLTNNMGGGSFKSQFKKANKSGARWALIIGEQELENGVIGLKDLRCDSEQYQMKLEQLIEYLHNHLKEQE